LGNNICTLEDVWAVGNNPAGIATQKRWEGGMSYHASPLMLGHFNTFQLAYAHPLKKGVLGGQVARFGDNLYNETKVGIAYAYNFRYLHIAGKANFLQIAQSTLGSQARFTFEFGAQIPLNKQLRFGVHLYNFTQSVFRDYAGKAYPIPSTIRAGLAYQPLENLSLLVEVEKNLDFPLSPRFGVEYRLHQHVTARMGLIAQGNTTQQTKTFAQTAGIGFVFRQVRLEYALASQSGVGVGHHIGFAVQAR
jgi:hypothetical protein